MKNKRKINSTGVGLGLHARRILAYVVLIIVSFFCLFWFYVLFVNATRSNSNLQSGFSVLPSSNLLSNWKHLLEKSGLPVIQGMLNSLIISTCSAVVCVYFSTMTAYAIHVYNFKLKNVMFTFILMIMMIPTQVTMIPLFVIMNNLGLINTYPSVILPSLFRAFAVFMLVQQMRGIPNDYIEAAELDGAGLFRIYRTVVLPLSGSAIATLTITTFMESWNDYLWPLLMLNDKNKMTLTLALNSLNGQYGTEYNILMAGSLLSMIPIVVIYALAQKYFKEGLMAGGVKG
mgnify:CR=1 FL=1